MWIKSMYSRGCGLTVRAFVGLMLILTATLFSGGALAQNPTVTLPGGTAITGVLSGNSLSLVTRTVPNGYMELFNCSDGVYRNPIIIVEGFDPLNRTSPQSMYNLLNTHGTLDMARAAHHAIWIINFGNGGGALTANAAIVSRAVQEAANYGGLSNALVDVIGISMGGIISRYALAYDEQNGGGSDGLVRLFISGDSPQQGANGPISLQEISMFSGEADAIFSLTCDAARSMLNKSVTSYEDSDCLLGALPSSSQWTATSAARDWFYNAANSLNGDGYPHKCRNIGISNGSGVSQPHSTGDSIYVARTYAVTAFGRVKVCTETYHAYTADVGPGSLGGLFAPGNIRQDNFELDQKFVATFIPYNSALDIRNGVSMFDRTLTQSTTVDHSAITVATHNLLVEEMLDTTPPTGSISINNGAAYTQSANVALTLSASENTGSQIQMRFLNAGAASWSAWETYAAGKSWALSSGDGTKYVYAQFKDAAGNISSIYSDSIVLDTIVPGTPGVPTDAGAYTGSPSVTFVWTASTDSGSGTAGYNCQIGTTPGGSNVFNGYVGNNTTKTITGTSGNTYFCRVQAMDNAGNTGVWSSVSDGIAVVDHAGVSIWAARSFADGISLGLALKTVAAVFGDCFYVEEVNRSSGIKVVPRVGIPSWLTLGVSVNVGGVVRSNSSGERWIDGVVSSPQ